MRHAPIRAARPAARIACNGPLLAGALALVLVSPAVARRAGAAAAGDPRPVRITLSPARGDAPLSATVPAGSRRWLAAVVVNDDRTLRLRVAMQPSGGTRAGWLSPTPALVDLGPRARVRVAVGVTAPADARGLVRATLVARVVAASDPRGRAVAVGAVAARLPVSIDVLPRAADEVTTSSAARATRSTASGTGFDRVTTAAGRQADMLTVLAVLAALVLVAGGVLLLPHPRRSPRYGSRARRRPGAVVALDVGPLNHALDEAVDEAVEPAQLASATGTRGASAQSRSSP